jgi:hypothetical protein
MKDYYLIPRGLNACCNRNKPIGDNRPKAKIIGKSEKSAEVIVAVFE